MILVLSPSKTLDYESKMPPVMHTMPVMLPESETLIRELRKYPKPKLMKLMDISDKLAALNMQRYKDFHLPFTSQNARPAILAFKGDVYDGIEVEKYGKTDFAFAQDHVRILSGLYGLLRPLDLMQPYRLEMGTKLKNPRGKDLYGFWGDRITQILNQELAKQKEQVLVNLASEEYWSSVRPEKVNGKVLNIIFKKNHKGKLQVIGLLAKKARGMMANFIVRNHIDEPGELKKFKENGYRFQASLSTANQWVFVN